MKRYPWSLRGPNKLQGSAILKISDDPLLGKFVLKSDEGIVAVAINKSAAEELLKTVQNFLGKT